jgi:hypothetical protein
MSHFLVVVLADGIPYALVTPDGEWHGQGKMGWWGTSEDDESDQAWYERVLELVRENAGGRVAIAVDCHV